MESQRHALRGEDQEPEPDDAGRPREPRALEREQPRVHEPHEPPRLSAGRVEQALLAAWVTHVRPT